MQPETQEPYSIFSGVASGVMTLDQACELADQRAAAGAFELRVVAAEVQHAMEDGGPDPLQAWQLARILAAAARGAHRAASADRKRDSGHVLMTADLHLISKATALLTEAGNIRVFTIAGEAAQEALSLAAELELPDAQGVILQRRGMMIITCYARGPGDLHALAFQDWVADGFSANPDPDLELAVADIEEGPYRRQGLRWLEPLEALALAESDLRAAFPLVADRRRGPVLKALSDALAWREMLGGLPAGTELIEICQMALDALAPEQRALRLAVEATLARAREQAADGNRPGDGTGAPAGAPATDADALAGRLNPTGRLLPSSHWRLGMRPPWLQPHSGRGTRPGRCGCWPCNGSCRPVGQRTAADKTLRQDTRASGADERAGAAVADARLTAGFHVRIGRDPGFGGSW